MENNNKTSVGAPYRAKYLVLLHTRLRQRALLFNGESDFLAELDDDGIIVDSLVRSGTPCEPPPSLPLSMVGGDSEPVSRDQLECYSLG